jgi:hypothetical protein
MKRQKWMDPTEMPLGSWAVFIGEDGPRTEKITGRLYGTTRNVYFDAGMRLDRDAGLMMGGGSLDFQADAEPPFQMMQERTKISRDLIQQVTTSRKWLILGSLHLHLHGGQELVFRFGACPFRGALSALKTTNPTTA